MLDEFACVYKARDYRAAELLGEIIAASTTLNQRNTYWLANALYLRGNFNEALKYARLGYSRLNTKDKAKCNTNINRCADLRRLLAAVRPSYGRQFAAEDSNIRVALAAAAREKRAQEAEAARAAAAVALDISGNGIHSTEYFHVNGEWELDWSYDCSNFGNNGNFIVDVEGDVTDILVNQLGSSDSGTEYVHEGGDVYLKINSECSWTVKAINQ